MKGVIAIAIRDLVKEKFGNAKWEEILKRSDIKNDRLFMPTTDIDDQLIVNMINSVCEVLGVSLGQVSEVFGDYWVNVYAPKIYYPYFNNARNAKEFLLQMDNVHVALTKLIPNARPPRFEYEWKDEKNLLMTYKSHRGLVALMDGLIRGVGNYYKEELKVNQIDNTRVLITFKN